MPPTYTVFYGTFIHLPRADSPNHKHQLAIHHGALWVSVSDGRIKGYDWSVANESQLDALIKRNGWVWDRTASSAVASRKPTVTLVKASDERNEFFFPGFIDTHIHAPQYPNTGIFGSSTLLDWLNTYTFPLEASFGSTKKHDSDASTVAPPRAHHAYRAVISRTLASGTTCASYFATIHVPATQLLATLCYQLGQRAFVGRVCMDNPAFCPEYYLDGSAEEAVEKSRKVIDHIHSLEHRHEYETENHPLIKPILTPRFAPTSTPSLLTSLSSLATSYPPPLGPLHIQTHISENTSEVKLVSKLFPSSQSYAHVYDTAGLLTPRTILAHAVHLTPPEEELIRARGTKVSHCPASNSALGSGICPVRRLLRKGVEVGLGTDVSGGYSVSLLEAVRQACLVSRLLEPARAKAMEKGEAEGKGQDGDEVLSVEDALYLATRGGAAVVDMRDEIGGFDQGMFFDAQLVRLGGDLAASTVDIAPAGANDAGPVDIFGWESAVDRVHKWVWGGDDRNVRAVWVRGRLVHSKDREMGREGKGWMMGWMGKTAAVVGVLGVVGVVAVRSRRLHWI